MVSSCTFYFLIFFFLGLFGEKYQSIPHIFPQTWMTKDQMTIQYFFFISFFSLIDHFKISCGHPIFFAIECRKHNIKKPPNITFWFFFQWLWKKIKWPFDTSSPNVEDRVLGGHFILFLFILCFLIIFKKMLHSRKKTSSDHLMLFVLLNLKLFFVSCSRKTLNGQPWFSSHMCGTNVNDFFIFFHFFGCCVDVFLKKHLLVFHSFFKVLQCLEKVKISFRIFFFWCNPMFVY